MEGAKVEGFKLYVGFTEGQILAVSPDNAGLEKLGRTIKEDAEEIEYVKDKEVTKVVGDEEFVSTVKQAQIDFHIRATGVNAPKMMFKRSFFMRDVDTFSEKTNKYQFVNQVGESAWAEDKSQLTENFTKFRSKIKDTNNYKVIGDKKYRVAKKGEADVLAYVRTWLSGFNYFDPTTNIFFSVENVFKGKFKEFQEQIGNGFDMPVVECLTVRRNEEDGKEYQGVWKTALKSITDKKSTMSTIRGLDFNNPTLARWMAEKKDAKTNPKGRYLNDIEKVAIEMTQGEYNCKDFFHLGVIKPYDAQDYLPNTDGVLATVNELDEDNPNY